MDMIMRTLSLAAALASLCAPLIAACATQHSSGSPARAHHYRSKTADRRPAFVPAHVQTAEYLWTPVEKTTDPRTYAPYLTWAYPVYRNYAPVHAAGIKTVLYVNVLMPHVAGFPDYDGIAGEYATVQAKDCSGNPVRSYRGRGYLLDVMQPGAKGAVRSIVERFADQLHGAGSRSIDLVFVDNANSFYGVTPMPCNFNASRWTASLDNVLSAVPYPVVLNTLSGHPADVPAKVAALRGSNIVGGMFEKCFNSRLWMSEEVAQLQTIALLRSQHKPPGPGFWCYLNGTSEDASAAIPQRLFAYASFLLTYDPQYSVFQESYTTSPSTFKVMPETQFVPLNPVIEPQNVDDLKTPGGAYVREYRYCYYRRSLIGSCEIAVNPGTSPAAIGNSRYRHSMTLSGGGVLDGGEVQFSSPAPSVLSPGTAAILVP
jgi:hypothetical protein